MVFFSLFTGIDDKKNNLLASHLVYCCDSRSEVEAHADSFGVYICNIATFPLVYTVSVFALVFLQHCLRGNSVTIKGHGEKRLLLVQLSYWY